MIDIEEVIEKLAEAEEICYYYKIQNPEDDTAKVVHSAVRAALETIWKHSKQKEARH